MSHGPRKFLGVLARDCEHWYCRDAGNTGAGEVLEALVLASFWEHWHRRGTWSTGTGEVLGAPVLAGSESTLAHI